MIIKDIFGNKTPILVENNNNLLTDAYDTITDVKFIGEIIENNDIYLLLEISHAKVTAFNKKIDFIGYITQLPLNRCIQIHLCRHIVSDGVALDSHEELQKEDWSTFKEILKLVDFIEYVSIEYYKDSEKFIRQLETLRKIQQEFLN